jgi:hypothetical protein
MKWLPNDQAERRRQSPLTMSKTTKPQTGRRSSRPSPATGSGIPTTWLDPLLTGPAAVIGNPPYDCRDIERLFRAIRKRMFPNDKRTDDAKI